jgi:hypothetical protein
MMCRDEISNLKFRLAPVFLSRKIKIDLKQKLNQPTSPEAQEKFHLHAILTDNYTMVPTNQTIYYYFKVCPTYSKVHLDV